MRGSGGGRERSVDGWAGGDGGAGSAGGGERAVAQCTRLLMSLLRGHDARTNPSMPSGRRRSWTNVRDVGWTGATSYAAVEIGVQSIVEEDSGVHRFQVASGCRGMRSTSRSAAAGCESWMQSKNQQAHEHAGPSDRGAIEGCGLPAAQPAPPHSSSLQGLLASCFPSFPHWPLHVQYLGTSTPISRLTTPSVR